MPTLLDSSGNTRGQWSFRLFGIPIHVQLWFWVSMFMMAGSDDTTEVLIWLGVCFVSILAHELGHVFAFRLFGEEAEVVLWAWGGLAVPRGSLRGPLQEFVVALAGPLAGFAVAGLTILAAHQIGGAVHIAFHGFLPTLVAVPATVRGFTFSHAYHWYLLVNDLLYINICWGLLNLIPVYPLDGGRAARAVCQQRDPYNGLRTSLLLSAIVAAAIVVLAIFERSLFLVVMFGVFAASSVQSLESVRRRPTGPSGSWR